MENVKKYFSIEYDISKMVYHQGFPVGYYLDIYYVFGEKHEVSDDMFNVAGSDKIQQYFRKLSSDKLKYFRLFMAELIIEFFMLALYIIVNIIKKRRKNLKNCS